MGRHSQADARGTRKIKSGGSPTARSELYEFLARENKLGPEDLPERPRYD